MTSKWIIRSSIKKTLATCDHGLAAATAVRASQAGPVGRMNDSSCDATFTQSFFRGSSIQFHNSLRHARTPRSRFFSTNTSSDSEQNDEEFSEASWEEMPKKQQPFASTMRNMVKPFFMRCHPDKSSPSAKDINLTAIQNLNSFLDSVELRMKPGAQQFSRNETTVFEIDFCIDIEERIKGKKEEILCRRKVELTLPQRQPPTVNPSRKREKLLESQIHVEHQLVKLLHLAGLKTPKTTVFQEQNETEDEFERSWEKAMETGDFSGISPAQIRFARKQKQERNRAAFVSQINWKRYDEIYKETVQDARANWATDGLIRDDPQRRMQYLAEILSRVRVEELKEDSPADIQEVDPIMQLIALRRLSLLLDEHFDDLRLEDLGRMWDSTLMILTPTRSYNTSRSALFKRRKRNSKGDVMMNDGFSFALHHDNSVTIHIPVDFRDEELLSQLKRHVKDYYSLIDLGLEDIFPRTGSPKEKDDFM